MIPIISIVGKSDAGKTTLIEGLLRELKKRGYRIGTVKHDVHGFEVDREGKDSWKHAQAGSDAVVLASSSKICCIKKIDQEIPLEEICESYLWDCDFVLTEGFKRESKQKIEVSRKAVSQELLCQEEDGFLAIVADYDAQARIPQFGLNDYVSLADFIERRIIEMKKDNERNINIKVDGKQVPVNPFVKKIIENVIKAMITSLKECEQAEKIEIVIRMEENK